LHDSAMLAPPHLTRYLMRTQRPPPPPLSPYTTLFRSTRPVEKVTPWWEYREHFLSEERISEGAHFWLDHKNSLEQISGRYQVPPDRKSTRLNSSHRTISYAVFCSKKKKPMLAHSTR